MPSQLLGFHYQPSTYRYCENGFPRWTPGSHLVVQIAATQGVHRRAYSILAGSKYHHQILVSLNPQGSVSPRLCQPQLGQELLALPPRGRFFKLKKAQHRELGFISAGVGIAPLIPMVKQALSP